MQWVSIECCVLCVVFKFLCNRCHFRHCVIVVMKYVHTFYSNKRRKQDL